MIAHYYTHVEGFPGQEAYVVVLGTNSIIVHKDGSTKPSKGFRPHVCEGLVRKGMWKEITQQEAERLVGGSTDHG